MVHNMVIDNERLNMLENELSWTLFFLISFFSHSSQQIRPIPSFSCLNSTNEPSLHPLLTHFIHRHTVQPFSFVCLSVSLYTHTHTHTHNHLCTETPQFHSHTALSIFCCISVECHIQKATIFSRPICLLLSLDKRN